MKIITLFTALIISTSFVFPQNIIKYKNHCDKAYEHFINKDYVKFINQINKIEKKYDLKSEELYHYAIALGRLNKKPESINMVLNSWKKMSVDWSFRLYDQWKVDSLLHFEKSDWEFIEKEYLKNKPKRGISASDSIVKLLTNRMDIDQLTRDNFFTEPDSINRISLLNKLHFEDSISQSILSAIIFLYGFPGDTICVGNQGVSELILWHSTSLSFYKKHNDILLKNINKGFISPYAYAYWYDRCMMVQSLPPKYFNYYFLPKISTKEIIKNRRKIGMSMYYEVENSFYN